MQADLITTLKRTADSIYGKGGVIRKLENLGFKDMPYKISKDKLPYRQAHYFIYTFDVPPAALHDLRDESNRDVDILRQRVLKLEDEEDVVSSPCTLEAECKEPAYRTDVQKLLRLQKKKTKVHWTPRSGLKYYPFQR